MKRTPHGTRIRSRIASACAAVLAVLSCLACQGEYSVSEGTTEAGNPAKVAGRIHDAEGQGAAARVRLVPEAYRNAGPGDHSPFAYEAASAKDGSFRFESVARGRFNLEAATAEGTRLLARSINVVKDTAFPETDLVARDPAFLKVDLTPVQAGSTGYVYMLGTSLARAASAADFARGWMLLDSVPAGTLPSVWFAYAGRPHSDDVMLAAEPIATPGDTSIASHNGKLPKVGVIVLIPPIADTTDTVPPIKPIDPIDTVGAVDPDSVGQVASSAAVSEFPMLLRLDSSNMNFARSKLRGRDCIFTDSEGNTLSYAIESWDSAAGTASVWVHLDSVKSNRTLFLKIGEGPADTTARPGVFDPSRGWLGVWHFSETGTARQSGYANDATQRGNYAGTATGRSLWYSRYGVAGGGVSFNGRDEGLSTSKPVNASQDFTVSLWFRTTTAHGGLLFGYSQGTEGAGNRQIWMDDYGRISYHVWTRESSHTMMTNGTYFNDGKWHFLAATWNKGRMSLYADGRLLNETNTGITLPSVSGTWTIGHGGLDWWTRSTYPSSFNFHGEIDEARVSSVVRSPAWIKLSYDTQKPAAATLCEP